MGDPPWTATELACGRSDDDVETRVCDECVIGDEDPWPWCDCRPGETCGDRGPCRRWAHSPDDCPQFAYLDPIIASAPVEGEDDEDDPFDAAVRFVREVKRQLDDAAAIEGDVVGIDYQAATATRLGGDAGRLAELHAPVYGHPPSCSGCSSARRTRIQYHNPLPVAWPCKTAELALGMMGLTASDIAITKKG